MREVYDIARATGVPAHISHYNGPADLLLPLIDEGRALGLDLTFDTYPYLAGSTILGMVALPAWVQEGGIEPTVERLRDPAIRARLNSEWFSAATPYALENITIAMVANPDWRWAEGLTVTAAAEQAKLAPGDFVCEILAASGMAVGIVGFRPGDRTEADVRAILAIPPHGGLRRHLLRRLSPPARLGGLRPLPRLSHPPARRLFLGRGGDPPGNPRRPPVSPDRPGPDPPGFVADIAVFDPATVIDRSTYAAGRTLAEGVEHVLVNGTLVLENGEPTGATPGGRCGEGEEVTASNQVDCSGPEVYRQYLVAQEIQTEQPVDVRRVRQVVG